jgi:hypothetical protein
MKTLLYVQRAVKTLLFVLITVLAYTSSLMAQPSSGGVFEDVTDTPVNTGIALMFAAGIGYGLKKLNHHKK